MTQTGGTGLLADEGEQSLPHARDPSNGTLRQRRTGRARPAVPSTLTAAIVAGIVGSGLVVWQGTNAAFTATTSNGSDSWAAGTLSLVDDDLGVALFTTGPVVPGASGTRCLAVTYGGTLTANVRLYATGLTGTLGPDLDLSVERGSGGSYADCTGFTPSATIYSGTLAGFAGTSTAYASGIDTWAPTGAGQTRVYRFTWTLDPAVANTQQGATASASFVWEAHS